MSTTTTITLTTPPSVTPSSLDVAVPSSSGLVQRRQLTTLSHDEEDGGRHDSNAPSTTDDKKPLVAHHDLPGVMEWEKVEPQFYKRKHKSIRRFYKQQNQLIERLQEFYSSSKHGEDNNDTTDDPALPPDPFPVALAIHASFALNVILLTVKIIASVLSGSMAVIASAADSLLDLLSGSVLVITHRIMSKSDTFRYPQGKSRMEPIGVFSFAIIMMLSSLQIIIEAVRRLVSRPDIELGVFTLSILAFTIFSKAFMGWYCRKVSVQYRSSAAAAYAEDHRNDVLTNLVGVVAAVLAVYIPNLWFLDSVGAICIALYIIFGWLQTGQEQFRFLTGRGASPMLLQQLTYIAANHDPRILFVDTVRAYHFGISYLVEIDIVLPEEMTLRESHDIGESLQHRIEELEDVERAFVHNDFEWDHSPVIYKGTQIIRK